MSIKLKIFTLNSFNYFNKIKFLTLPCLKGEISIYKFHTPLLTYIKKGYIKIFFLKKIQKIVYISNGIVIINNNNIKILSNYYK